MLLGSVATCLEPSSPTSHHTNQLMYITLSPLLYDHYNKLTTASNWKFPPHLNGYAHLLYSNGFITAYLLKALKGAVMTVAIAVLTLWLGAFFVLLAEATIFYLCGLR